jgi:hypothetical protein
MRSHIRVHVHTHCGEHVKTKKSDLNNLAVIFLKSSELTALLDNV